MPPRKGSKTNQHSRRRRGEGSAGGRLFTLQRTTLGVIIDGVPDNATAIDIPAEQRPYEDLLKSTLWQSVTMVRRGLLRARLSFQPGAIDHKYMRYCYNVSINALDYGKQAVRSAAFDISNEQRFKRRLLNSILPTDLPTSLPTTLPIDLPTNKPTTSNNPAINNLNAALNQENKQKNRENATKNLVNHRKNFENDKKNQANYLLEMRIRTTVRRLLSEVKSSEYWRDSEVFERLMIATLVELQDPDVQWASYSDIYIAAGLVLYQEGALQEIFSHKAGSASRLSDHEARQKDVHTAYPVMRTSVKLDNSFVVLPNQRKYYEILKNNKPMDNDSGRADSASAAAGEATESDYLEPVSNPPLPGAVVPAAGEDEPLTYDNQGEDGRIIDEPVDESGMSVNQGFGFAGLDGMDDEETEVAPDVQEEGGGYITVDSDCSPDGSIRSARTQETAFATRQVSEGKDAVMHYMANSNNSNRPFAASNKPAGEDGEHEYHLGDAGGATTLGGNTEGNAAADEAGEDDEHEYHLGDAGDTTTVGGNTEGNAAADEAGEDDEHEYYLGDAGDTTTVGGNTEGNAAADEAGEDDEHEYYLGGTGGTTTAGGNHGGPKPAWYAFNAVSGATAGEEESENYEDIEHVEDEGHGGTPPREARLHAASSAAAFAVTEPDEVLPSRFAEADCLGTIVEQTRSDIRDILNGNRIGKETIADLVRNTASGHLVGADKEQKAIRAIAELSMQELLATPEFNAFQCFGIPNAVYDDLHNILMRFVNYSRVSYASKNGSVPGQVDKAVLFDSFDQLIPVMNAFARLYLQQVTQYLDNGRKPPQIFLLEKREHSGEKRKNYHVVVNNGISREVFFLNEHFNKIDPVTKELINPYFAFAPSKKQFKSIDSEDVGKSHPPEVITYGSSHPYCHAFLDKNGDDVHDVVAVCTVDKSALAKLGKAKQSVVDGIKGADITEGLFYMISNGALQQAYNMHDDYALGKRAKRWLAMHPYHWGLPLASLAVVAAGAGAAYGAGVFEGPPPCNGYNNINGACVSASALPATTACSYEVLSSNLDEGGVVRLQPRCELGDVQASTVAMQINNIPAGAVVTANGKTLEVLNSVVDVSEYINTHEVHVDMPDGYNTPWTPEASFSVESGALSKAGSHSAAGAVTFTPVAQTATVATSGTFIVSENADQAFTVTLTPGPGDSGAKLFARNMAVGDQLCGVDMNGAEVCVEATALGQTHELPFARNTNNQITVTYKPAEHSAGVKSFELFGKSVDSTLNSSGDVVEVEGAESVAQAVTFSVNPVATAPFNAEVPVSIYAVEGEFSEPFTLRAQTHDPVLKMYLLLEPGAAVRGTLAADNSTVTIENTSSSPQQFDVSSWNNDSFQNRGGGIFDVLFESVHGTETQTIQQEPGFQVFELPTFQIIDTAGNILSGLSCSEDQVCGPFVVNANADAKAVSGIVEVTLPTVNTPFAGHFALNGTLADGTAVSAQGPIIDVSGWRLNDPSAPFTITPVGDSGELNVNSGNTPSLAIGISGSYQDASGNTASNSYSAPISIKPVADQPTLDSTIESRFGSNLRIKQGSGLGIKGEATAGAPQERIDSLSLSAMPVGIVVEEFDLITFQRSTVEPNSDGTVSLDPSEYIFSKYAISANLTAPLGNYSMFQRVCAKDGTASQEDELCIDEPFTLSIIPRS